MQEPNSFRCYLIGGDTLLVQCAEILLARGHQILGVISDAERIVEWAQHHGIPAIPAKSDYTSIVQQAAYDYLFAITHLALIPEAAANSPRKLAINFHDGPLPAYAGLNTPLWAIVNGETQYGITWHVMSSGIDAGDILIQQPVSIAADETGLSLNTKCFAAALESFPVLVDQLTGGSERRQVQSLGARTYFSRSKRPEAACVLDWRKSADELERLVRALNVGRYPNPVGSAKLLLGKTALVVDSAVTTATHGGTPGQIAGLDDSKLSVQTANGVLEIIGLRRLDGSPISIASLTDRFGITTGQTLPQLSSDELERLAALGTLSARHEPAAAELLAQAESIDLPYRSGTGAMTGSRESIAIAIPQSFRAKLPNSGAGATIIAAFVLFLGRVLGRQRLSVAVAETKNAHAVAGFEALFATHKYLAASLDAEQYAWPQLGALAQQAARVLAEGPHLRDLVARQPSLRANSALGHDATLPVALVLGAGSAGPAADDAALVLRVSDEGAITLEYEQALYSPTSIAQLNAHFVAVLEALGSAEDVRYGAIDLVSERERTLLLKEWNDTSVDYDDSMLIHQAFERQVESTPDAVAVACEDREISYRELDRRAQQLARHLRQLGIGPDVLVGVHVARSIELMVATLAVLKAGGAYVPLDPAFPADRLEFMVADSAMPVIITQSGLRSKLPPSKAHVIEIDAVRDADVDPHASGPQPTTVTAQNLAYVIYTSGSTGRPKGVTIEHRNVINFFLGMDAVVPRDKRSQETWLAVTSLSFDISVLELFWTLTRGFKVVIHQSWQANSGEEEAPRMRRAVGLGLFMWGNDDAPGAAKYRLLMEGAKFFDANGLAAVWTPERHFHAFGGPYPNPAVTGAAVAAVTRNVKIRAGSCVVPLHHPIRIAEEWAVVDNLSDGRVEIAAASGWNPNDFVLKPENHAKNKEMMFTQLEQVRRLWRGEKLSFPGPLGKDVEVQSLPRPVQAELPCWVTTAGNPETWRDAGSRGLNVLTHLLGQTVREVGEKIRLYREARAAAGFDPAAGRVALMLHTFVGADDDSVRELVREPMKAYLASSMRLAMNFAWSFPAFKRPGGADTKPEDIDINRLSKEEIDTILDFAFDRYFSTSGLFGSLDTCLHMLQRCSEIGVDEVACLLDFGVDTTTVLETLPNLKELNDRAMIACDETALAARNVRDYSFAGLVRAHRVTHLQCTPSMARMFASDSVSRDALARVPHLLLGGEGLPVALARELNELRHGTLTNVYGPTETTIWSMAHRVESVDDGIPIGRPIANTSVYVLDDKLNPVPVGIPGQLYIGGDGVARGYLNRPELTNERFIPSPFDSGEGARIYATGDLAKYRPDGTIDFLGRADFQVKVRGYRIELGEIESVLEGQAGVREAAVVVRSEDAGDQRLVAYVVGHDGSTLSTTTLKAAAGDKLPDYMIPNEFVVLSEMPRTANGKLDRKALQSLRTQAVRSAVDTPPASEMEESIAGLWRSTLKLEAVGTDENFFDLGGHSLLVVQLHNELKKKLNLPLSLTDLYQYPTIRSLSDYLSSGDSGKGAKKGASRGARRRALRSHARSV